MSQKGVNEITEKFLGTGDLFGLKFNSGIVFLEVRGWKQNRYAPYSEFGEVGAQSGTGFQRLEIDNDDILFTEKQKLKVKHVAIGQRPSIIRRYSNYPEDENRLHQIENLGAPKTGDDFGYVNGHDSPYGGPTEAEELWIPPGEHLNFNFYNPDSQPHNVVVDILMREYNIRALDPDNRADRKAIARIMQPGSPIPIGNAGSMDRQVRFELQNTWETETISEDKARQIANGGGK